MRHGLADDVGASDHDGALAGEIARHFANQDQAAERRAGHGGVLTERQPASIDRVKAVDILGRIDGGQHRRAIHAGRQRQLHEDAVHVVARIQLFDQRNQLRGAGGCRQAMIEMR